MYNIYLTTLPQDSVSWSRSLSVDLMNWGDLRNQLRTQNQLRVQRHGLAARGRPRRCESALQNSQGARRGRLGLWVLLRFRLTLAGRALRI